MLWYQYIRTEYFLLHTFPHFYSHYFFAITFTLRAACEYFYLWRCFPCRSFPTSAGADRNGQRFLLSVLPRVPDARAEAGHARVLLLLVAHREDGAVQEQRAQRAQRAALSGGTAEGHRLQDVSLHGFPARVGLHLAAALAQEESQPAWRGRCCPGEGQDPGDQETGIGGKKRNRSRCGHEVDDFSRCEYRDGQERRACGWAGRLWPERLGVCVLVAIRRNCNRGGSAVQARAGCQDRRAKQGCRDHSWSNLPASFRQQAPRVFMHRQPKDERFAPRRPRYGTHRQITALAVRPSCCPRARWGLTHYRITSCFQPQPVQRRRERRGWRRPPAVERTGLCSSRPSSEGVARGGAKSVAKSSDASGSESRHRQPATGQLIWAGGGTFDTEPGRHRKRWMQRGQKVLANCVSKDSSVIEFLAEWWLSRWL